MVSEPQTSVNDLIEHFGIGKYQAIYIVAVSIMKVADGVEVLTLSFMGLLLECAWNISSTDIAIMTMCVFVGMLIGAPIFGNLADRYGRKSILIIASLISLYYGLLSSVAQTFVWFCFLRLVLGCGIGGNISVSAALLSEICPTHFRAKLQCISFVSWSIGSFLTVGVAAVVLPYLSWRWFIFFVSLPMVAGIITLLFLDESLRFLVVSGQKEKAMKVIKNFSHLNSVAMPIEPVDLSSIQASKNAGNISLLFSKRYRCLSFLQFLSWFAAGAMYYGAVIISTNMPAISYTCLQNSSQVFHSVLRDDSGCCQELNSAFYASVAISTIGDLVSTPIIALFIDILGRKLGITVFAICSGIGFFALNFCMPVLMRSVMFLFVRCFTLALAGGWYIFTLELYPTSIRNTALGMCQVFSRTGGAVTSLSSVILLRYNTRLTLFTYVGLAFAATILILCVPIETKNAPLEDDASLAEDERLLTSNNKNYASVDSRS